MIEARTPGSADANRQPHAVLDLVSRRHKGRKIEYLLGLGQREDPLRMLEIGTGSGGIAHYFGTHPVLRCEVDAVDVHDSRQVHTGYRFHRVVGTRIPFDAEQFDVVLSNHVIEHVGDHAAQLDHLHELRRVMKPGGVGYLAVPNRWMLVEPHYRLAFLSWLPRKWRSGYVRAMKRGYVYDCEPLSLPQLDRLLTEAGLGFVHLEIEALHAFITIEGAHTWGARMAGAMPDVLLGALRCVIPTLMCRLERK